MAKYETRWVPREGAKVEKWWSRDGEVLQVFLRGREEWVDVEPPRSDENYGIPTSVQMEDGTWKANCAWYQAYGLDVPDFEPNVIGMARRWEARI